MSLTNISSDLDVQAVSRALEGFRLDVVVSGSIGAVESVRFIRCLRRLGADVTPWLTAGGAQFVTPTALAWAAAKPAVTAFSGENTHLATGDACIVAPASANFLATIAGGLTNTPAGALVQSYFGSQRPVIFVPSMHDSLRNAPAVNSNIDQIIRWQQSLGLHDGCLSPRTEEGKQKFPEPAQLADEVAHRLRRHAAMTRGIPTRNALITLGTTRGYLDDVRYLSNYSTGALGTAIAHELYRRGIATQVIAGPAAILPTAATAIHHVETNEEMLAKALSVAGKQMTAGVFAASVLDYVPTERLPGKVPSGSQSLNLQLKPTTKIISQICNAVQLQARIGFKLEIDYSDATAKALADQYANAYGLTMVAVNRRRDVDMHRHFATVFARKDHQTAFDKPFEVQSKQELAGHIANHIETLASYT